MSKKSIKYPTWLEGHIKDYNSKTCNPTLTLCSSSGNEMLEVWYYGEPVQYTGDEFPYISDAEDAKSKIVARDEQSGEEFLIFDHAKQGYDNMFCDVCEEPLPERPLKKYEIPKSKLILELGYDIDYDDEKDDYEFDKKGRVILVDGSLTTWGNLKRDGIDFIALYFVNQSGEKVAIMEEELA